MEKTEQIPVTELPTIQLKALVYDLNTEIAQKTQMVRELNGLIAQRIREEAKPPVQSLMPAEEENSKN